MRIARSIAPGVALAGAVAAGVAPATGDESKRVDRLAAEAVKPGEPGVAVLVLDDGKELHARGYGLANVEERVAIDRATTFDLASVSKQFTAYAALILEERGELALGDEVRKHVRELQLLDPKSRRSRPILVADLLHHVSGLPDYLALTAEFPKSEAEMTNVDVARLVAGRPLDFPTGTKFGYSNTNYLLAALVIERASGRRFGRVLHDRIFAPLGMRSTRVLDHAQQTIPRGASGYGGAVDDTVPTPVRSDLATTGDGGVWSCLDDFARWDAELRAPKLVKPATLERAMTSGRLDDGSETGYGFGWAVGRDGDQPIAEHSGGWMGFVSHHLRHRTSGLTIVVLSNRAFGGFDAAAFAHRIAGIYRKG